MTEGRHVVRVVVEERRRRIERRRREKWRSEMEGVVMGGIGAARMVGSSCEDIVSLFVVWVGYVFVSFDGAMS